MGEPYDVGMTGLVGFSSGYNPMESCDALLMLGTDFPYRPFYPTEARVAQVDIRPQAIGRRVHIDLGIVGQVGPTLRALMPRIKVKSDPRHLDKARTHYVSARKSLDELATGRPGGCCTRSTSCASSMRRRPTTPSSPQTSACRSSGPRAISR
jgi:pyruvate dehydrogenase (quinone)